MRKLPPILVLFLTFGIAAGAYNWTVRSTARALLASDAETLAATLARRFTAQADVRVDMKCGTETAQTKLVTDVDDLQGDQLVRLVPRSCELAGAYLVGWLITPPPDMQDATVRELPSYRRSRTVVTADVDGASGTARVVVEAEAQTRWFGNLIRATGQAEYRVAENGAAVTMLERALRTAVPIVAARERARENPVAQRTQPRIEVASQQQIGPNVAGEMAAPVSGGTEEVLATESVPLSEDSDAGAVAQPAPVEEPTAERERDVDAPSAESVQRPRQSQTSPPPDRRSPRPPTAEELFDPEVLKLFGEGPQTGNKP